MPTDQLASLSVVMLGASGAVGGIVAQRLQAMPQIQSLTLLNRRKLDGFDADKTHQHIVDVENPLSYASQLAHHNCAICCLGVGQPSKISKEEFVRIDKDTVLGFAQACKAAGVKHFQLLSSAGADSQSRSFYLRTKGQLLDAIQTLGFERVSIFQPSMILTPTNRYGLSQGVLLAVWPALNVLMQGGLRQYRGVAVADLGLAIAKNTPSNGQGYEILQWDDFQRLIN